MIGDLIGFPEVILKLLKINIKADSCPGIIIMTPHLKYPL